MQFDINTTISKILVKGLGIPSHATQQTTNKQTIWAV